MRPACASAADGTANCDLMTYCTLCVVTGIRDWGDRESGCWDIVVARLGSRFGGCSS